MVTGEQEIAWYTKQRASLVVIIIKGVQPNHPFWLESALFGGKFNELGTLHKPGTSNELGTLPEPGTSTKI